MNRISQNLKCINCYKCIRNCPVKSIKIKNDRAYIIKRLCIGCGNCSKICPQNLKKIRSDINIVKEFINKGEKVIAIIDPHIVADLNNISHKKFIGALKKIGFYRVEENSIGYDIVLNKYKEFINTNKQDIYLSSMCPSINYFITRYHSKLVEYLLPFETPTISHAIKIKQEYENVKVVLITCCISKKFESIEEKNKDILDAVLTFEDIFEYIKSENINMQYVEEKEYDDCCKTELMFDDDSKVKIVNVSGIDNVKDFVNGIEKGEIKNIFMNVNTCKGACFGGFGYKNKKSVYYREDTIKSYLNALNSNKENNNLIETGKVFEKDCVNLKMPGEEEIRDILVSIGKKTTKDELNCGVCGYDTCRDKAIAVWRGYAEPYMCMPYIKDKNQDLSNVIFEVSPNYIVIVAHNFKVIDINESMLKAMGKKREEIIGSYIGDYIDITPFVDVFCTQEDILHQKVNWHEFNKELLGNIVYLRPHRASIAIYNDITNEENQKKKFTEVKINTINTAQKVIEKQMRVAQEIASLMGETTAETKVILTKLKELAMRGDD